MDANLLLFKHLALVQCGSVATTTATLSGFRRTCAWLRTVIAGDGWGTIAVPVIEAT